MLKTDSLTLRLTLAAACLLIYLASASSASAATYKVEMLVFKHLDNPGQGRSPLSAYAEQPDTGGAVDLLAGEQRDGFRLLTGSTLSLNGVKAKLEASGKYQIMEHIAWRQPGLRKSSAKPVRITSGHDYSDEYPERMQSKWSTDNSGLPVNIIAAPRLRELDGTVKIVLGRFLHIYTDLIYRKPVSTETVDIDRTLSSNTLADFTLKMHRRMRSRELHYIDHPMLGILVRIVPL